ncbi:cytochrome P450 [Aspergillus cavernicola]|uniref:Cytochrome P450 n=1 Tax=Aspergillus cavernicola TaxID=176166 RepID=A0ABR4IL41_9EURO
MLDLYQVVALGAVAALGFLLSRQYGRDPREPPSVGSRIPFFGHLLGLLQHGTGYFSIVNQKHPSHPILSIDLILTKIYLISSPTLLQAVQRNSKTISFDPFLTSSADRLAGIHGPGLELLREKQAGGQGISQAVIHAMLPTLTGKPLDRMNERMVRLLGPLVDELAMGDTVDLYAWCRHAITAASTDASYGPLNPYKDQKIEDAFWAFESNISPLLAGFLPSLIARTAWKGRETALVALIKYYNQNGQQQGSELTKARWKTMHDAGISTEDIARLEVSMAIGLLSNTVPAVFRILYELYSSPDLLQEIRQEVRLNALCVTTDGVHVVSIPALRDTCPLLVSTYQEILRSRGMASPTRIVTEDVILADKYLLKKGAMLSMPGSSMSRHSEVWGPNADEFNPRRFMKTDDDKKNNNDNNNNNLRRTGGFMTFGVSPVICPGRHFASSEILSIVAMIILRLELVPVDGGGVWREPKTNSKAISSIMRPLKDPFNVRVLVREEYEGVKWDCEAKDGSGVFNLMVG